MVNKICDITINEYFHASNLLAAMSNSILTGKYVIIKLTQESDLQHITGQTIMIITKTGSVCGMLTDTTWSSLDIYCQDHLETIKFRDIISIAIAI